MRLHIDGLDYNMYFSTSHHSIHDDTIEEVQRLFDDSFHMTHDNYDTYEPYIPRYVEDPDEFQGEQKSLENKDPAQERKFVSSPQRKRARR